MQQDNSILIRRLFTIALPIMLQNLLSSSLSFLDTLMIGQLGEDQIAAVGIGNQTYFLISLFFFGIASGTSIFLSQYFGSKEYAKMRRTLSFSIFICLIGSVVMTLFSYIKPEIIIHCFSFDPPVVESGIVYLKIVAPSYMFSSLTTTLSIGLRSKNKANIPLLISFISLSLNALGNYLLIFGIGPFPELGVAGAAISTSFARFVEMLFLVYFIWGKKDKEIAIKKREDFSWDKDFVLSFVKTCLPVLLNEILWAIGMTLYKVAFSRMGTEALAASNIIDSIANFFFIAMMGIGNGTTILIGNILGSGDRNTAIRWSKKIIVLAFATGLLMGLLEFSFAPFFSSLFNVSEAIKTSATIVLRITAFLLPIKSINMTTVVGILRAGGDTRYAMLSELAGVYLAGVPCAFLGAVVLSLSLPEVYLMIGIEEFVKLFLSIFRIKSNKWANVITDKK